MNGRGWRSAGWWVVLSALGLFLGGCTTIRVPLDSTAPVGTPSPTPPTTPPVTPPTPPVSKLNFAYVENDYGNSISMYNVSSAGLWTPTSPATVPVGDHPESLVVHPSGRFVYVPTIRDNSLWMFAVNAATGLLTPLSPAMVPTGAFPQYLVADPLGRFVYTANSNDNTLSMYAVDSQSGVLHPTSPASIPTKVNAVPNDPTEDPIGLAIDPKGRFLYSCNGLGSVTGYAINQATGVLTPTVQGSVPVGKPFTARADPSGQFLYVADTLLNRIEIFAINQTTGALTPASTPFLNSGDEPTSIAFDPTGTYTYVVNRGAGTISQYTRNAGDGSLTPLNPGVLASPGQPWQMLVDPSGQLAYVSQESTNSVSIFSIGSDGTLHPYSSAPTQSVPGGIGIAQLQQGG